MTFKWQKKLKSVLIDTLLLSGVYTQLFLTFTSSPKTEFLDQNRILSQFLGQAVAFSLKILNKYTSLNEVFS